MGMEGITLPMNVDHDIILVDLHLHFFADLQMLGAVASL